MDFEVDPENLRTVGSAITETGLTAAADLGRDRALIEPAGDSPWGSSLGANAVISAFYGQLTELTGVALDLASSGMGHSGSGLLAMGESYEHADETAHDGFQRIEGEFRGLT
ncbi:hypothetical protein BLA60_01945 [Actinophytocola xinjiangensis]|uniref:Uncharacterized protein n=1 Tax=Actinophytocola xinjiangensis TaxID=485602 RepID=A0A7Z0WSI0_9PSEU|nr:hypothetical protein [Actinophytocola xinjiangensis]OLF13964.1 hypothetical protein BLA60_01945 [Actinophytocola xinjiangensis]